MSHPGKNFILVYLKMPNIYILCCAKTSTIVVSCEGHISKLTESRETFAAWFLPKIKIQDQGRPLAKYVKNFVGG